jgi:hypothetical protein
MHAQIETPRGECFANCCDDVQEQLYHLLTAMLSNENKMSDGGRDRALLGVEVWKSSQKWSVQRSAVRSIAWLDRLACQQISGQKGNGNDGEYTQDVIPEWIHRCEENDEKRGDDTKYKRVQH